MAGLWSDLDFHLSQHKHKYNEFTGYFGFHMNPVFLGQRISVRAQKKDPRFGILSLSLVGMNLLTSANSLFAIVSKIAYFWIWQLHSQIFFFCFVLEES